MKVNFKLDIWIIVAIFVLGENENSNIGHYIKDILENIKIHSVRQFSRKKNIHRKKNHTDPVRYNYAQIECKTYQYLFPVVQNIYSYF